MGLLDDAIREHLELKRRHGASDEEIQQQENEALGPARREFAGAEPMAPLPSEDVAEEEELAYEDEDELAYEDAAVDAEEPTQPAEPAAYPEEETVIYEPPSSEEVEAAEPAADELEEDTEPSRTDETYVAAPVEPPPPPPSREPASSLPPLPEFPPAEPEEEPLKDQGDKLEDLLPHGRQPENLHDESGDDDSEEDVLEETPEFLQDAPEHDRLWFEQKPPRDFDFD
ncbi:MAG: hypothetical protein ACJ76V_08515 [Thermoleophilaceae bacterium]